MIFVTNSLEDWLKKHPDLYVCETKCNACGQTRKADRPFISKGWAGLISEKCKCGKNRSNASVAVCTDPNDPFWG